MRLVLVGLLAVTLAACDLKTAFSGNVEVVARAGELELRRDTLAAVLASGKWTIHETLAEVVAYRWVEYALAGQRFASGDSLLDSATVFHAMWPDASQWLVDYYHDSVLAGSVAMDSAAVDSTYRAGEHRLFYHILIRTRPDMTPPERRVARVRATRIYNSLGRVMTWEDANEENEDPAAKRAGGSLGLVVRGAAAAEFEEAAFRLEPGAISDVVETQYGFHIIRRPLLASVREEYKEAVEQRLLEEREAEFLTDLEERWEIRVRASAPDVMREAVTSPLHSVESSRVIGDYRDNTFTAEDFVRWLHALSGTVSQTVGTAPDEQLMELARTLVRNEVLILEAQESGVTYREGDFAELRDRLRDELDMLRHGLAFDSAFAGKSSREERLQAVSDAVLEFFRLSALNRSSMVVVPAFVADKLRSEMDWEISVAGVEQAFERAEALRAELSAVGEWPPPDDLAAPDSLSSPDSSNSDSNE